MTARRRDLLRALGASAAGVAARRPWRHIVDLSHTLSPDFPFIPGGVLHFQGFSGPALVSMASRPGGLTLIAPVKVAGASGAPARVLALW